MGGPRVRVVAEPAAVAQAPHLAEPLLEGLPQHRGPAQGLVLRAEDPVPDAPGDRVPLGDPAESTTGDLLQSTTHPTQLLRHSP